MPHKASLSITLFARHFSKNIFSLKNTLLMFSLFPVSQAFAFDYGNPSILEQGHLELINRARLNPDLEAKRLGINLLEGTKPGQIDNTTKQPLSFNAALLTTSRNHSKSMLDGNFFEHTDKANHSPWDRFKAVNYNYTYATENIAMIGVSTSINSIDINYQLYTSLFIDQDYQDRLHRVNLLNPKLREIGVGLSFGIWHEDNHDFNSAMLTTDFGTRKDSRSIVLGVVYSDQNKNNFYDPGEGLPGVNITISGNSSTVTATAGGYGLEVDPQRDYSLTFSHPVYGSVIKTVRVNDLNVKVDVLLNEFPNHSSEIIQRVASSKPPQQCPTLENNRLQIPCLNAVNQSYQVELGIIERSNDNRNFRLGIRAISPSQLADMVSCDVYDPKLQKAILNCVKLDNKSFRAELTVSDYTNPIVKLELFENSNMFITY